MAPVVVHVVEHADGRGVEPVVSVVGEPQAECVQSMDAAAAHGERAVDQCTHTSSWLALCRLGRSPQPDLPPQRATCRLVW